MGGGPALNITRGSNPLADKTKPIISQEGTLQRTLLAFNYASISAHKTSLRSETGGRRRKKVCAHIPASCYSRFNEYICYMYVCVCLSSGAGVEEGGWGGFKAGYMQLPWQRSSLKFFAPFFTAGYKSQSRSALPSAPSPPLSSLSLSPPSHAFTAFRTSHFSL